MDSLSIVMVTRNDGYGKDMIHRLNTSISSIVTFFEKECLNTELIIVEWNPPKDRKNVNEIIDLPSNDNRVNVKVVRVPKELHEKQPNSDSLPFFEYVGKNVGIKRAKSDNILSTNSDVVFNKHLARMLSHKDVYEEFFYRTRRYDVSGKTPPYNQIEKVIKYCRRNTYRVSTPEGFETVSIEKNVIEKIKKIVTYMFEPKKTAKRVKKILGTSEKERAKLEEKVKSLFLMTSGDFLLMKRKMWEAIGGYREKGSNLHVDGLACVEAMAIGLSEKIIGRPAKLYHPEHDRSERDERPKTQYSEFVEEANAILKKGNLNRKKEWGLSSYDLEEVNLQ